MEYPYHEKCWTNCKKYQTYDSCMQCAGLYDVNSIMKKQNFRNL